MTTCTSELPKERQLLEDHLSLFRPELSSWSWTDLFAWSDFFEYGFEMIDGHLCVFASDEAGCFMYLPPLGPDPSADLFRKCFTRMESRNGPGGVTRVENIPGSYPGLDRIVSSPGLRLTEKTREYIYYRNDLCRLKGNAYKSCRAAVNQFVKNTEFIYRPYEPRMYDECLSLYRRWARERKASCDEEMYRYMLDDNERVHARLLRHAAELGLTGRTILIDGEIRAYTFGFALTRDVFCVLLEIADLSVKGLAACTFREFCDDPAVRPYSFINAMDDYGLPALTGTKMSYRPVMLAPSYILTGESV